jgi:hypothetical protein
MERRTFVLHSELSLKIRSRARHTVNSWKKERDDGLKSNCYYELISCVLVYLKRANYSESTPISKERLTRTHHEAAALPPTPTLRCRQAAATATVTYVLIVVVITVIVAVIVAVAAATFS